MDLEKTVTDLHAQNSQFQEALLALTKGQQDMMAWLAFKKKPKKKALLNMGRRFKETVRQILVGGDSSEEDGNQIGEVKSTQAEFANGQESDDDYFNEQYPPADIKYKQLEDRLKAIEIQAIPDLNFDDLSLIYGVVIPHKFKIPTFAKYDGVSCPKLHLKSYVRKIQPHTTDKKLWIHFFQESLAGT